MFRPLLVGVLACAVFTPAPAGPGPRPGPAAVERVIRDDSDRTFTLDEAVAHAIEHNPTIRAARFNIERARGVTIEIRAAAMPRFDAGATLNATDEYLLGGGRQNNYTARGSILTGFSTNGTPIYQSTSSRIRFPDDRDQPTTYQWGVQFEVNKTLYDGGSTRSQIAASKLDQEASRQSLAETINTVINDVRTTFYECLLNEALITVREQAVQVLQEQLKNQQQRYAAGVVPQFNVLQAEVALANELPNLIVAKNNYRISLQSLARLLALGEAFADASLAPNLTLIGELRNPVPTPDLADALNQASLERPQLLALGLTAQADSALVRAAQAGYLPKVAGFANYGINKDALDENFFQSDGGYRAGVSVNVPIWDGGITRGRVIQSKAQLESTRALLDEARRQVEFEVRQAFLTYLAAKELIQSQEKTVEQATEALRQSQARLDSGAGTQLDVLNARFALTEAQSTVLQAWYAYQEATANLDKATGNTLHYLPNHESLGLDAAVSKPGTPPKAAKTAKAAKPLAPDSKSTAR